MVTKKDINKDDYQSWMADNFEVLKDRNLSELCLPGTHDSGAYQVDFSKDLVPHDKSNKNLFKFLYFIARLPIIGTFIKAWVVTQKKNIQQQLEAGIRAFDLRVSLNEHDGKFYISHTFATVSLDEVYAQIKEFMQKHPKEILIINMTSDRETKSALKGHEQELFLKTQDDLTGLLCKKRDAFNDLDLQVGNMVKGNGRIVIFSDIGNPSNLEYIWPGNLSHEMWLDVTTSKEWEKELDKRQEEICRNPEVCTSVDAALTPNFSSGFIAGIIFRLKFLNPLQYLANQMKPVIANFLADKTLSKPNIVNSDYINSNSISPVIKYTVNKAKEIASSCVNSTYKRIMQSQPEAVCLPRNEQTHINKEHISHYEKPTKQDSIEPPKPGVS